MAKSNKSLFTIQDNFRDCENSYSFFINTKTTSSIKLNPPFPKDIKRGVSFTIYGKK